MSCASDLRELLDSLDSGLIGLAPHSGFTATGARLWRVVQRLWREAHHHRDIAEHLQRLHSEQAERHRAHIDEMTGAILALEAKLEALKAREAP